MSLAQLCENPNGGLVAASVVLSCTFVLVLHALAQTEDDSLLASLLFLLASLSFLIGPHRRWLSWLSWFNFDASQSGGFGLCLVPMTPVQSAILSLLGPYLQITQLWLIALPHWLIKRRRHILRQSKSEQATELRAFLRGHCRTAMHLLLASYTSAVRGTLDSLLCVEIDSETSVVFETPAINCRAPDYASLRAVVYLVLILHVAGLPLLLAVTLFLTRAPHQNREPEHGLFVSAVLSLCANYQPTRRWYRILDVLRRLALVAVGFIARQVRCHALRCSCRSGRCRMNW